MLSVEISHVPACNTGYWHSQSNLHRVLSNCQIAHVMSGDWLWVGNKEQASKWSHITGGEGCWWIVELLVIISVFPLYSSGSPIFNTCDLIWNSVSQVYPNTYRGWFLFFWGLFLQGRYHMLIVTQSWSLVGPPLFPRQSESGEAMSYTDVPTIMVEMRDRGWFRKKKKKKKM